MTAVAAEAAVVVDNGRETSGETSLWHGAAAGAAARVDPLLRRISGLTRFDRVSCGRWLVATASFPPPGTVTNDNGMRDIEVFDLGQARARQLWLELIKNVTSTLQLCRKGLRATAGDNGVM